MEKIIKYTKDIVIYNITAILLHDGKIFTEIHKCHDADEIATNVINLASMVAIGYGLSKGVLNIIEDINDITIVDIDIFLKLLHDIKEKNKNKNTKKEMNIDILDMIRRINEGKKLLNSMCKDFMEKRDKIIANK